MNTRISLSSMIRLLPIVLLFVTLLPGTSAFSQTLSIDIPPSLILNNYDRMSIGSNEGLEAGAYVARTNDAGANWYNPAGISRSEKSSLNAAGTAYEWSHMSLDGLGERNTGNRISTIATYLGAVLGDPIVTSDKWRVGFSISTPINWAPGTLNPSYTRNTATGTDVIGYYSELNYSEIIPALAAGFHPGGDFRFGANLGGSITNMKQLQSTSNRSTTSTEATISGKNFVSDGSEIALYAAAGMQVDLSDNLLAGLRIVAPSVRISGSSKISYQASIYQGTTAADLFFRDQEAKFDYRYPLEIDAGVAMKFTHAELEVDVKYHGMVSDYAMYSSGETSRLTTTDSNGVPTVTNKAFTETMNSAKEVVNVSVGGNYAFDETFALHAGFRSDMSPVVDGTTGIFRKVDLYGGTVGFSVTWVHLSGSVGFSYSTGSSDETEFTAVTGEVLKTSLNVSTLQMLLALSYGF